MTQKPQTPPSSDDSPRPTGQRLIFDLLHDYRRLLVPACVLATSATLFELLSYWLLYLIAIDVMTPVPEPRTLIGLALLIVVAALLRFMLFGAAYVLSHRAAFRLQKDLRGNLVAGIARLPLGSVDHRVGELKKAVMDDVAGLEHLLAHAVPELVASITAPILGAALLLLVDWRMSLVSLALLPVGLYAQRRTFHIFGSIYQRFHRTEVAASTNLLTYLRGITTLRAYNRSATSLNELRTSVQALASIAGELSHAVAIPHALYYVALSTNLVIVVPVALLLHLHADLTAPQVILFALMGTGLTAPLLRVALAYGAFQKQMHGVERIAGIVHARGSSEPAAPAVPRHNGIDLHGVRFGYDDGDDVLRDVSLSIADGSVTALIGPSGSGKSTLVKLIARYWEPRDGAIRIGGVDVRNISRRELQDRIGIVFQDPYFFHGTLRENLALAAPNASDEEMRQALAAVALSDLLNELPQGLETLLGERASRLSGGERQRLAIARTLLKNPRILLLDEATAFADPCTELLVREAVSRLMHDRTVIVIAHRLSTIAQADRIVVMQQGRIAAAGRHDDLLQHSSFYRQLWHVQAQTDNRSRRGRLSC